MRVAAPAALRLGRVVESNPIGTTSCVGPDCRPRNRSQGGGHGHKQTAKDSVPGLGLRMAGLRSSNTTDPRPVSGACFSCFVPEGRLNRGLQGLVEQS